jgi:hypothetical protein
MNEIIKMDSQHIKITPYSIEFGMGTTWEEARQVGIQLLQRHDQIQFYIGDWILYCTSLSGWGKMYEQALEKTDYSIRTLWTFVSVAKRFPPRQREQFYTQTENCSFTRLHIVTSCTDEQIEYLFTRSDEEGWSCARLREEVKKLKHPATKLQRWWVNLTDPMRRAAILATPHIDKKVKGKKVYILTGVPELPELPQPNGGKNEPAPETK